MAKILHPNAYFKKVEDISYEYLIENGITSVVLDVDNTLIDYDVNITDDVIKWVKYLKEKGLALYILSNSGKKSKIDKIAGILEIPYIYFAKKPLRSGFLKVIRILDEKPEKIAMVGDQIFTDVLGGNICKMFTILVDQIDEKDFWYTAWKRPIEDNLKKKLEKLS